MATRHFAVFFADIADSTVLYKQIGDELAKEATFSFLSRMMRIVERYGGTVIKTIGDELMARFDTADEAIDAARSIQQECGRDNAGTGVTLKVKIGIHHGPAILEANDIFGDTVNTAARMVAIAKAEQIVITEETVNALSAANHARTQAFDYVKVKSFDSDVPLYLVNWHDYDSLTVTVLSPSAIKARQPDRRESLRLVYGGQEIVLTPKSPTFTIGRDESLCAMVVDPQFASRKHAWIEFRREKFVLVDYSSNGTWVRTADDKEIYLRREEFPLWGHGWISLGQPLAPNLNQGIEFFADYKA